MEEIKKEENSTTQQETALVEVKKREFKPRAPRHQNNKENQEDIGSIEQMVIKNLISKRKDQIINLDLLIKICQQVVMDGQMILKNLIL